MNKTVEIHDQTWKVEDIQQDIDWSKQQSWEFTEFTLSEEHEHCFICYWTIFKSLESASGQAYKFNGNWLCQECYGKFLEK